MPVGTSSAAVNLAAALEPAHLELARNPLHVELPGDVRTRISHCREFVLDVSGSGCAIYGVTTGFGPLVEFAGRADGAGQSGNTILHRIVGHGELMPSAIARAAVPAWLFSLAQGRSGVAEHVVEALIARLGTEVFDRIAGEVPPIVGDRRLDTALGATADLLDTIVSEVEGAR